MYANNYDMVQQSVNMEAFSDTSESTWITHT